jgi:hypothetical protein
VSKYLGWKAITLDSATSYTGIQKFNWDIGAENQVSRCDSNCRVSPALRYSLVIVRSRGTSK